MNEPLLSVIIGGAIAIVSGVIGQVIASMLHYQTEKKKFVFNKLEDIVTSISTLEQGVQYETAKLYYQDETFSNAINLSFEQNKLECLINIYHPQMKGALHDLIIALNKYYDRIRELSNFQRLNKTNEFEQSLEHLNKDVDECLNEFKRFISRLGDYGNQLSN